MDLNPVFAIKAGAIAADVRIVRRLHAAGARATVRARRTSSAQMNRIMKPDAVAVIGASDETGKIGNSVMKNLINGGYKGKIYPINPSADEIMGLQAYKSVKDVPGDIDVAVFAIPAKFVRRRIERSAARRRSPAPSSSRPASPRPATSRARTRLVEIARKYDVRLMGPNIYGFYYTPKNLCATFCTAYDVKGKAALSSQSGGIGMAIIGFSRSAKMGVSAIVGLGNKSDIDEDDLLTFFEQDDNTADHRAALRGPEGRPRVRRSREARVEEEAGRHAQGRAAPAWARAPPARTPARWPATTRSTTTCSGSRA